MSGASGGEIPSTMHDPKLLGGFPYELFLDRRDRVLAALGDSAMVLPSAPILLRGRDTELPYRPDSELFYLTGFSEPHCVLVLRGFAEMDRAVLFMQPRDPRAERWSGARLGPERAAVHLGVDDAKPIERLEEELGPLLAGAERVYFRLDGSSRAERPVLDALRIARTMGVRQGAGPYGVMDPGMILNELRLKKDAYEIEAIRKATEITVEGFRSALSALGPGMGEWEMEAELEATFRRLGATGPAFPSIVGAGANACVLHYIQNSRRMEAGDLVLLDAGAELRMYGGDVSRTAPVSGRFSSEQRDLYDVVDEARRAAVGAVRPGVGLDEVHARAVSVLVTGLKDLGILTGSEEELIEAEAYAPYYPHRTSHWLGLETHDVGDYARNGTSRLLEPDMVLTIEPGLYFPPDLDGGRFAGMGVRIEDDVLVTQDGVDVLTSALPTSAGEVEELVGARAG